MIIKYIIQNILRTIKKLLNEKNIKYNLLSPLFYAKSLVERLQQNKYELRRLQHDSKVILFLLPARPVRSGGVISIVNLCITTRKLVPEAHVILATFPSFETYSKITWFKNSEKIYRFSQIVKKNFAPKELYIHIPEYLSNNFESNLTEEQKNILKNIHHLHINILDQNILLMPERSQIEGLFSLTLRITQTTAHDRYANQQVCNQWGIPLHHFSAVLPNPLAGIPLPSFEEKVAHPIIVLSPDKNPNRGRLYDIIEKGFSGCKIKIVKHMSYSEYFSLISKAMFVVTFGEGFDAYFTQPFFVNTIAFSVFNTNFFPNSQWKNLENVFESYDHASKEIVQKMNDFSHSKKEYLEIIKKNKKMIDDIYNQDKFEDNIVRFYQKKYDFIPTKYVARNNSLFTSQ